MSRNVSTCRSGRTSRCVSACGLMSRIATKPSVFATWSPSRTSLQKRQSSGDIGEDPLLRDRAPADGDELAERTVDEPGRVVGAVAAAGPVDEHDVAAADLRAPSARGRPRPRARAAGRSRSFFTSGGTVSSAAVRVPGRGEYGKTCTFVSRAARTVSSVRSNAGSSSAGKPTITSAVRLKSASGSSLRRYVSTE